MTIRLVDSGWVREIADAVADDASELRIICPFIKVGALDRLLSHQPMAVQVITRFNLADFAEGVSDIAALRKLASADARVRGVRNLHAKLYLFGGSRVIVTSANLTQAALNRNHEFGLVSQETGIIKTCRNCFDNLWARSGDDLSSELIEQWDQAVTHHRALGGRPTRPSGLGDFGANAGIASEPPVVLPPIVSEANTSLREVFRARQQSRAIVVDDDSRGRAGRLPLGFVLPGQQAPIRCARWRRDVHFPVDEPERYSRFWPRNRIAACARPRRRDARRHRTASVQGDVAPICPCIQCGVRRRAYVEWRVPE